MTFTYAYATNPRYPGSSSSSSSSGSTPDLNTWVFKTTESRPDGSQQITYANYAGQTMLSVLVGNGMDSTGSSSSSSSGSQPTQWCTFFKYNAQGQVVLQASPSAVTGYDESYNDLLRYLPASSKYQYLRDNDGLISLAEFYAAPATPLGYLKAEKIQKGQLGSPILLKSYEYGSQTAGSTTIYPISKEIVYPDDTTSATTIETSYAYTYYSGTVQVQQQTTTLPVVSTGQNGSGTANTRKDYFDQFGYLTWSMDERGFITNTTYDVPTGGVTQQIEDVDTSVVSGAPSGWTTPAGGGLNLTTDYTVDTLGRATQSLGPAHTLDINGTATSVRRAEWTVYDDSNFTTRTAGGYQTISSGAFTLINPVGIVITNQSGSTTDEIQATRASTSGKLLPTDTFAQASYVRWTTYQYTDCCKLSSKRVYFLIPTSGSGSSGTNYNQTDFGYDTSNRQNRIKTPGGTITFTTFNSRNLPVTVKVGTDDSGSGTDNMRTVTASVYDNGTAGGDGNLTQVTQYVDATTTRVTSYTYDFRNRRLTTDGEVDYFQKLMYDNLDRVITVERYNTTAGGTLIGRSETKFDDLGRVYQTIRYAVNPSTGAVGNSLTDNQWYDAAGNDMKTLPAGAKFAAKTTYDGINRPLIRYLGYNLSDTTYATAGSVTGDTIFEQTETTYDAASNVIQSTVRQRYDNATGTGPLTTPSGSQPKARVTYAASWHDGLGRVVASADYGTNGGTALSRPSTIPGRSDSVLVSSATYNNDGEAYLLTDPASRMTYLEFDDAGRRTKLVENYLASSSSSSSSAGNTCAPSSDANRTTTFTYSPDGNLATLTAVNADTTNQTTTYTYGTTLIDSDIAASLLLRQVAYPDSTGDSDVVSYKYNRQAQRKESTDQLGTVHAFNFDGLGRITQDRVTALGTNVDGALRRLQTSYEVRGMPSLLTSYDNATVGSGSIVNEVGFNYNDFGQITKDQQSHSGAVGGSTPNVQYAYANGSANTIRPTQMTYPSGRQVNFDYGAANSQADILSRIAALIDNDAATHLADYTYLGLGTPVVVDYTQPDVKYTLIGTAGGDDPDTGDIYRGLDRFGRVKDAYWYDYGSSTDAARIQYGYNRVSNRTYRADPVAVANSAQYEELYAYDGLQRLSRFNRGTLNGTKTGLTAQSFAQCWTLDSTGNWKGFRQDDTGDGTWDLVQSRTANAVNEITGIAETAGPSWADPAYNAAGNMTTIPQPAAPTSTYAATYDAWNRLVKLVDGANTVAEYQYDPRTYRTVAKNYTGGVLTETRHYYYSTRWHVVEERLGTSTTPDRQFVWGLRYIDDLVLRERSVIGTLDERLYGLQDGNWNMIALTDTVGDIQERYAYHAYGTPKFLTAAFGNRTNSNYNWETLYTGYRWDRFNKAYFVRDRNLHPSIGTWQSRDPIAYANGLNLFQYVTARPLTLVDARGNDGTFWNAAAGLGNTVVEMTFYFRDCGAATVETVTIVSS
jgi:RHS repeat-associated protein